MSRIRQFGKIALGFAIGIGLVVAWPHLEAWLGLPLLLGIIGIVLYCAHRVEIDDLKARIEYIEKEALNLGPMPDE